MTIPKRDKRRKRGGGVKALPLPPANKAILEHFATKNTRRCEWDYTKTNSIYCPKCGRITRILE